MRKKSFTLSAKILASFIAASLAVFLYIAYSIVVSIKESTYISEKEKATILLDSVASEIGMSLYLGFDAQGIQKAKELLSYPDVLSVSITTASGKVIGQFGALNMGEDAIKEAIKVKKVVKDSVSGKDIAVLQLYYSNRNYLRLINNFEQLLFKFFAISTLIFSLTLFFVKRLLSPLSDIAERMREYIPGKNITFKRKESDDEIGSIIASFEAMQTNIDTFLEEIRKKDGELMRQSKLKALADMINAVAHNWRQPLNAIGIMLQDFEFAHQYGELNEAYIKENVAKSMELLNQMSKTIDDFRLFFVSSTKEESIDVGEIAAEVVAAYEKQLSALNIRIHIDGDGFLIMGQKEFLREVIGSFISNSKDAIGERLQKDLNFKGDIAIKLEPENKRMECVDNGGGMSEDVLARAFEPYYTTKEQGKGVGLGLFMSRTVIANMNGELAIANKNEGLSALISFGA
jgi:signal transduction histidine kinase